MSKSSSPSGRPTVPVWTRLDEEDAETLRAREALTGATVSAQIRIIVRAALHAEKKRRVLK